MDGAEVERNLRFSADSLELLSHLGRSKGAIVAAVYPLCLQRRVRVRALGTMGGQPMNLFQGQIFVMFQQIDPETL